MKEKFETSAYLGWFSENRTRFENQHGGRFIVLGHQYGRRYVM